MKATLWSYAGLVLIGLGIACALYRDPDALILGVPALIIGSIVFVENLKRAVAKTVVDEIENRNTMKRG